MKSYSGDDEFCRDIPRELSISASALFPTVPDILIIPDLDDIDDPAAMFFKTLTKNSFRYYAGVCITVESFRIGMLFVLDHRPHILTSTEDRQNMLDLSSALSKILSHRRDTNMRICQERDSLLFCLSHNLRTPVRYSYF